MTVSALVLAGGRAERMDGRKAERRWRDGTLLSHVVAVARAVTDDVLVAPGARADLRAFVERPEALTWIHDDPLVRGEGPLGGLLAGLERAAHPWVWLLACDMPWLAPEALDALLAARDAEPVVAYRGARGVEPFGALVRRDAAPAARERAAAGERSLRGLLAALGVRLVEDPPMTRGIPTLPMLHNVNTLDELADARRRDAVGPPVPPRRTPRR